MFDQQLIFGPYYCINGLLLLPLSYPEPLPQTIPPPEKQPEQESQSRVRVMRGRKESWSSKLGSSGKAQEQKLNPQKFVSKLTKLQQKDQKQNQQVKFFRLQLLQLSKTEPIFSQIRFPRRLLKAENGSPKFDFNAQLLTGTASRKPKVQEQAQFRVIDHRREKMGKKQSNSIRKNEHENKSTQQKQQKCLFFKRNFTAPVPQPGVQIKVFEKGKSTREQVSKEIKSKSVKLINLTKFNQFIQQTKQEPPLLYSRIQQENQLSLYCSLKSQMFPKPSEEGQAKPPRYSFFQKDSRRLQRGKSRLK